MICVANRTKIIFNNKEVSSCNWGLWVVYLVFIIILIFMIAKVISKDIKVNQLFKGRI